MGNRIEKYIVKGVYDVANDTVASCRRNLEHSEFDNAVKNFNFLKVVFKDMQLYSGLGFNFDVGNLVFTEERIDELEEDLKKAGVKL